MEEVTQSKSQKPVNETQTNLPGNRKTKNSSKGKDSDRSRYIKTARLGKVTIYRRGKSYWLYFRDSGKSIRKKIDGSLVEKNIEKGASISAQMGAT